MFKFLNNGLLKNLISYTIIAFIISIFVSSATLPKISESVISEKNVISLLSTKESNTINKIIKDESQYFLQVKGEDTIVEIQNIKETERFENILKASHIEISQNPVELSYLEIFGLTLNIFLFLIITSFLIIFSDFHSLHKKFNPEKLSFKDHFFAKFKELYFPSFKSNIVNYSNPIKNKLFLFAFIAIFAYNLTNAQEANVTGAPNQYIISDLINDIGDRKISYVDITIEDGVTNLKATNLNGENKYFSTGNADEIKSLLTKNNISYNENNKGDSFNWTPFIITFFVILAVILVISGISKGLASSKGGLFKGKDFEILATKPNVTLNDVKGIEEIKEEINEVIELLNNKTGTNSLGGKTPKGILIEGQPGVGKTLLAKAIANETDHNFIYTNGAEFAGQLQGQGADNIKNLFKTARENQPAIIFIDEIDGVGQKRGSSMNSSDSDRTLNRLLVELDGFDTKEDDIIVIGATNFPDKLDPALIRAGRFDREITIPLPRYKGRLELLEYFVSKVKSDSDIDLNFIAHHTSGFSGASLENLVNEAALLAARKNKDLIESEDFEEAQAKLVMGHKLPIEMSDKERWMTAYHEADEYIEIKNKKIISI